jgi:hypothetical protein
MRKPNDVSKIDERKRVMISAEIVVQYGLPKKAIGAWVVVEKSKAGCRLRKVRQDGFLMSDKYNNHQFISAGIAKKIGLIRDTKMQNAFEIPKLGTRKTRWIGDVVQTMKSNEVLSKYISEFSDKELLFRIYEDTTVSGERKKLYSSIDGAIRVWRKRCYSSK